MHFRPYRRHAAAAVVIATSMIWTVTAGVRAQEFAWSAEPGWSSSVIAVGQEAEAFEQMDIIERPYRPFHIYGNTMRRWYYRGNPLPTLDDINQGAHALLPAPPPASHPSY